MDESRPDDVKEMVRARDGYCCTGCGMGQEEHRMVYGKALEVHRLIPGSPCSLAGCQTLCIACHGDKTKSPPWATIRRLAAHLPPDLANAVRAYVDSQVKPGEPFFAQRLRGLREQRGLSRYGLAKLIKKAGGRLSAQAIANLEGGAVPSFPTVECLASALGVPLDIFRCPPRTP